MKTVALAQAKAGLSGYIEKAQKEKILITNHGKPMAILVGVEGANLEDLFTEIIDDPQFWKWIEERRKGSFVSLEQAYAELGLQPTSGKPARGKGKTPQTSKPIAKKVPVAAKRARPRRQP